MKHARAHERHENFIDDDEVEQEMGGGGGEWISLTSGRRERGSYEKCARAVCVRAACLCERGVTQSLQEENLQHSGEPKKKKGGKEIKEATHLSDSLPSPSNYKSFLINGTHPTKKRSYNSFIPQTNLVTKSEAAGRLDPTIIGRKKRTLALVWVRCHL